jgi:fibronectin-binding autotransporter adhesin
MMILMRSKVRWFHGAVMICALSTMAAQATVFTWSGTGSNEVNNPANWGGTGPANAADVVTENPDWQLPDVLAGGASYNVNLTAGTGAWFVGGDSLGGITFLGGGSPTTPYTITGGDASAVLNIAGSIDYLTTTNRGIVLNNSTVKQTLDLDILNWQSTFDAKNGDIEIKAGHTFTSGGGTGGISSTSIRNQHVTQFKGDKTIYLNATVLANTSSTSNRGSLVYLGADTTPTAESLLVLGDIGTGFQSKVLITSANGGAVRAIHNNSLGFTDTPGGFSALYGTEIGLRSGFSNGSLELDGGAGNLTIGEFFRLGVRTVANGAAHIRNVAGNNTLTGGISLNYLSDPSGDSMFFESTAGKLTMTGSISNDRPSTTSNMFLKGAGAIDIGGALGIDSVSTTGAILNVDKSGAGTATMLAGTVVSYTGTTAIHSGSFILNGTHTTAGAAAYTVDATGTLGGSGTIGSTISLAGKIAPGDVGAVGTLTVGGLSLTGGILDFQLDATNHTAGGAANDLIIDTGALDLTAGATLNVAGIGGNLTAGDYDLIQFAGALTGSAANITPGTIPLGAGLSASIIIDADSVNLHIAVGVPGDFNSDGKVNASDYVVWRKGIVVPSTPANYALWRSNFGAGAGSGLGANSAVPEPTCIALVALGTLVTSLRLWTTNRNTKN